ncbi:MAG: nuclear transport factor 2 family protein [Solirubrobacterales bacterium]|nr:nuclear transport factor 2 family protein [Solirubrobacterales bacterium]
MINAVERLWQALAAGDLHRARSELHSHVVVEWPHSGERFEGRDAYLAAHEAEPGTRRIDVRRVVTEGRHIASEVRIADAGGSLAVASFYTVHDGRILHAVEYRVTIA